MKIRLLSDLHTEFRLPYKTHEMSAWLGEQVLVVAGDVASGSTNTTEVLRHFKAQGYQHVIYVPGNHEYYGTEIRDFDAKMRARNLDHENIHFLNPGFVVVDDVLFIGAALWTDFQSDPWAQQAAGQGIADFRLIRGFNTQHCVTLNQLHKQFIKTVYESRHTKPVRHVVVVTHFLPAVECIAPRWRGPNLLNKYFSNDLGSWISELENTTWMFGHTHDATDIQLGNTRVVANPHGYYNAHGDGEGFNAFKMIEV